MDELTWEGVHCSLTLRRPIEGVVVLVYRGTDIGELGDRPFRALQTDLAAGLPLELFIDARATSAASIHVSGAWATWLASHRAQLHRLNLLVGSDLMEVTVAFASQFSGLGQRARLFRDPDVFERLLAAACEPGIHRHARAEPIPRGPR